MNLYNSRLPAECSNSDSHPNEDNLTRKVLRTRARTLLLPSNTYARCRERRSALYISCKGGCNVGCCVVGLPWDLLSGWRFGSFDVQKNNKKKKKNKVHDRLTQRGIPAARKNGKVQARIKVSPAAAQPRPETASRSGVSFSAGGA